MYGKSSSLKPDFVVRLEGYMGKSAIPKSELIHNEYYFGECRNATVAQWNAKHQDFTYIRSGHHKNDQFLESINHYEDDDGCDLFVPFERVTPKDEENVELWFKK